MPNLKLHHVLKDIELIRLLILTEDYLIKPFLSELCYNIALFHTIVDLKHSIGNNSP